MRRCCSCRLSGDWKHATLSKVLEKDKDHHVPRVHQPCNAASPRIEPSPLPSAAFVTRHSSFARLYVPSSRNPQLKVYARCALESDTPSWEREFDAPKG